MNRYQVHCCRKEVARDRLAAVSRDDCAVWSGVVTPPLLRLGPEVIHDLLELLRRVGKRLLYGRLPEHGRLEVRCSGRLALLPEVVCVLVGSPERPGDLGKLPTDGIRDPERLRRVTRRVSARDRTVEAEILRLHDEVDPDRRGISVLALVEDSPPGAVGEGDLLLVLE